MSGWLPIDQAPKSTATATPTGLRVVGRYLLGFIPDDVFPGAPDRKIGINVIWWEPRGGPRRTGAWVTDANCGGDDEVHPTHFMELPEAPPA